MSAGAEHDLDHRLAALRSAMASVEPPAEVDAAIARALARRTTRAATRRWRVAMLLPVALAASLVALAVAHWGMLPFSGERAARVASAAGKPTRTGPASDAGGTAFVPVVSLAELEHARETLVVSANLPGTSLAEFGLPVNPARATEPVAAELLIRPDGAVLAIRFGQ